MDNDHGHFPASCRPSSGRLRPPARRFARGGRRHLPNTPNAAYLIVRMAERTIAARSVMRPRASSRQSRGVALPLIRRFAPPSPRCAGRRGAMRYGDMIPNPLSHAFESLAFKAALPISPLFDPPEARSNLLKDALRPDTFRRPRRAARVKSAASWRRERSHAQLAPASEHGEHPPFDAPKHRGALPLEV
jgi:hypothetical protein